MKVKLLTIFALCALGAADASSAMAAAPGSQSIKEIASYVYPKNTAKRPSSFYYMPDGTQYAMIADDGKSIRTYDIKTGNETGVLVDLNRTREVTIPDVDGFFVSPDGKKVVLWREPQYIYRRSFTAEYYVYDVKSRLMDAMSPDFKRVREVVMSPKSDMIAFVAPNNDIYLKKLVYNNQVRVTTDGAAGKIINGATDWTYEEEFTTTRLMAWSPDDLMLCFVKTNETNVPVYSLPLYEGTCNPQKEYAQYPGQLSYKYPVAGVANSRVTLHSYDVELRKTKQIPLPDKNIEYIPRIDFGPEPQQLMVSALNRDQNRFELYSVNPASKVAKSVLVETSNAWIEPDTYEGLTFEKDGFVVLSGRSGYQHLYKYSYAGALQRTLTSGDYDVTAYYGSDAAGNHYYQSAQPTPLQRTVYCLDAKGNRKAVSATNGTAAAQFSPDHNYAVYSFNNPKTPPVYRLCTAHGKELRTLEDNAVLKTRFDGILPDKEFIKVPSDGLELNGFIIRPFGFDPSKKYPVVMTQYSGPGSQSVLDRWELDWMDYFASKGFIIVCVDGRGTGGRGNKFMHAVYRDLGHYETIDQINAAKYVATLPGVDPERIGICGWSYGGYETLMCATAQGCPFAAAVAIAPVTDWRYYDTVYSERFMLTPQQNESGYNASAPLRRAARLACPTLIMYGTADDNVHPANSLQFVSALQSAGGYCDMFVFPNMNHSIYGCNARAVVYGRMFEYFKDKLK
ncbi:MAG: DPP IV N-terminal domain-containing protein [Muribaculaceae bacterium]|nr:DPP IV N-terminal domain-containing protein [Muribaculaceae bacterium]